MTMPQAVMSSSYPLRRGRLFLVALCEPLIRFAAGLISFIGKDSYGVEMRLRGIVLGGSLNWRIGRRVQFAGPLSKIRFGIDVTLYGNTYIDANGELGGVSIGRGTSVDHFSVLYGQGGLNIGDECALAAGVIIYAQTNQDIVRDGTPVSRQPTKYAPVSIGNDCWIGAGARVLPGVSIGPGCFIGAGAVVLDSLPDFSVAVGIPARIIRNRHENGAQTGVR